LIRQDDIGNTRLVGSPGGLAFHLNSVAPQD
jgi:hypothetical protein